jgi:sarcosine oxidase subunit alpha
MELRVTQGTHRGARCVFTFESRPIEAYQGETVAAALLANGQREFRQDRLHRGRGPYCNMGTCFECVVQVRQSPEHAWRLVRACLTAATEGLEVRVIP